jgi:hypothetical protein
MGGSNLQAAPPPTIVADIFGRPNEATNDVWYDFKQRNGENIRVRIVDRDAAAFAYAKNQQQKKPGNANDVQFEQSSIFYYSDFRAERYTLRQNGKYLTNARGEPIHILKVSGLADWEAANDNADEFARIIEAAPGTFYALEATPEREQQLEEIELEVPSPRPGEVPETPVEAGKKIAQFLQRVVPWPENPKDDGASGYVNVHWTILHRDGKPGMAGKPVRAVAEFLRLVQWIRRRPKPGNIYFCLSLQRTCSNSNGKLKAVRSAENALAFKAVCIDLDVKEGAYATKEKATAALDEFVARYQLPYPNAIVVSGSGLHVYWISKRTLSVDEWRRWAEGLKRAALEFDLHCDAQCTVNAAQLLRVPGTWNYKTDPPKEVFVDSLRGEELDFEVDLKALKDISPPHRVKQAKQSGGFSEDFSAFKPRPLDPEWGELRGKLPPLGKGLEEWIKEQYPPPSFAAIKEGCAWLREVHETGGANEPEPRWYQAARCCVYLENGEELIHELGNKHPGYTRESTEDKFEHAQQSSQSDHQQEGLSWPLCKTIKDLKCKHCKDCPHFGEDGSESPLHLGLNAEKDDTQENDQSDGASSSDPDYGLGLRFMRYCRAEGMSYKQAHAAILASKSKAGEWANRVDERQLERAWGRSEEDEKEGGEAKAPEQEEQEEREEPQGGRSEAQVVNPIATLMKLRDEGADLDTLLTALNQNFAVVKRGSKVRIAYIIGKDVDFMLFEDFHNMLGNLVTKKRRGSLPSGGSSGKTDASMSTAVSCSSREDRSRSRATCSIYGVASASSQKRAIGRSCATTSGMSVAGETKSTFNIRSNGWPMECSILTARSAPCLRCVAKKVRARASSGATTADCMATSISNISPIANR